MRTNGVRKPNSLRKSPDLPKVTFLNVPIIQKFHPKGGEKEATLPSLTSNSVNLEPLRGMCTLFNQKVNLQPGVDIDLLCFFVSLMTPISRNVSSQAGHIPFQQCAPGCRNQFVLCRQCLQLKRVAPGEPTAARTLPPSVGLNFFRGFADH